MDVEPHGSKRFRKESTFVPDFLSYALENDPTSYQEVMKPPDAAFWKEDLNSEIEYILANHTWELIDLPSSTIPLVCKWISKKNLRTEGQLKSLKIDWWQKDSNKRKEFIILILMHAPVTMIMTI